MHRMQRDAAMTAPFPRGAILLGAITILVTLLAATIGRFTEFGALRMPSASLVEYRDLRFTDRDDGAVVVRDARSNQVIGLLPPASDSFIRGVLRSLVRERRFRELSDEAPFRLARTSDGYLILEDRATATNITINAFGPTNARAFAQFLNAREVEQ